LPNNTLAVIKDFSKTQADGSVLTTANLLNLNTMATFKAVRNSRKFTLDNNNELVPVTTQTTFNMKYLVPIPPIVVNALIIPWVLRYAYFAEESIPFMMLTVGTGEIIVVGIIGLAVLLILDKVKYLIFNK
jgi:hypothetical protein